MDLVCYLIDDHPVDIRPADNRRQWMDDTPDSYAYRCLPLSIANAHGWEKRQYNFALGKRAFLSVLEILGGTELKIDEKERKRLDAQGWYMRGQMPDGTKVIDHRKSIHLKPFDVPAGRSREDRTTDPAAE